MPITYNQALIKQQYIFASKVAVISWHSIPNNVLHTENTIDKQKAYFLFHKTNKFSAVRVKLKKTMESLLQWSRIAAKFHACKEHPLAPTPTGAKSPLICQSNYG